LLRKLTENMESVIVMIDEKGDLDSVEYLPEAVRQAIQLYLKQNEFKFEFNKIRSFPIVLANHCSNVVLCGVGNARELNGAKLRTLFANSLRAVMKLNGREVYLFPAFANPLGDVQFGHILAESALLAEYKFNKYQADAKACTLEAVHLAMELKTTRHINRGILEGRIFADATNLARDLVNEPANVVNPETLAETARKLALKHGFSIDVFGPDKLRRIKMDAFLAVARGSAAEPRLILMSYHGNPDARSKSIGLIGKGLTYDSGGYCLKTPQGMVKT